MQKTTEMTDAHLAKAAAAYDRRNNEGGEGDTLQAEIDTLQAEIDTLQAKIEAVCCLTCRVRESPEPLVQILDSMLAPRGNHKS